MTFELRVGGLRAQCTSDNPKSKSSPACSRLAGHTPHCCITCASIYHAHNTVVMAAMLDALCAFVLSPCVCSVEAYETAVKQIEDNREAIDKIVEVLLEKETLTGEPHLHPRHTTNATRQMTHTYDIGVHVDCVVGAHAGSVRQAAVLPGTKQMHRHMQPCPGCPV